MFTTATPSTPYIGQNYAGGIVFYVDSTGCMDWFVLHLIRQVILHGDVRYEYSNRYSP